MASKYASAMSSVPRIGLPFLVKLTTRPPTLVASLMASAFLSPPFGTLRPAILFEVAGCRWVTWASHDRWKLTTAFIWASFISVWRVVSPALKLPSLSSTKCRRSPGSFDMISSTPAIADEYFSTIDSPSIGKAQYPIVLSSDESMAQTPIIVVLTSQPMTINLEIDPQFTRDTVLETLADRLRELRIPDQLPLTVVQADRGHPDRAAGVAPDLLSV